MGSSISYKALNEIPLSERKKVMGGMQPSLEAVAQLIKSNKINKIVCVCGAGISVAAGIPDFRTKGTGLYDNLEEYGLERPESIFDIEFFRENPKPFIHLSKTLFPGQYNPTVTHHFMKLLEGKNKLLRVYTQNIDGLEYEANISDDKVVQCHGGFRTAHCILCNREQSAERIKNDIMKGEVSYCTDETCGGLCKPGITFFGENLPARFHFNRSFDFARKEDACCLPECKNKINLNKKENNNSNEPVFFCSKHSVGPKDKDQNIKQSDEFDESVKEEKEHVENGEETPTKESEIVCECDLLLVFGTSLSVQPVAGLVDEVHWLCPRVLINNEERHLYGERDEDAMAFGPDNGFRFHDEDNYRDVAYIDSCDDGCRHFAQLLGWQEELDDLIQKSEKSRNH